MLIKMANQISQELSFSNAVSINYFVLVVFYLKLKFVFVLKTALTFSSWNQTQIINLLEGKTTSISSQISSMTNQDTSLMLQIKVVRKSELTVKSSIQLKSLSKTIMGL